MTDIQKASWSSDENSYRITMPITKVNKENRLVSGFASLDNVDAHGDMMTVEANRKAFAKFRGNIREQHSSLAVGKLVDLKEDSYFDSKSNETFTGVYVTAYISKGAQDTWEKVVDGTLSGFSIGGNLVSATSMFDKTLNRSVRVINEYTLNELSLVDNPANQLANVFSIQKSADGQETMTGLLTDIKADNALYCKPCGIAKATTDNSANCPEGHEMVNIGWFEYVDDADKVTKMSDLISTHENTFDTKIIKQEDTAEEGGVNVEKENTGVIDTDSVDETSEVEAEEVAEDETVEKSADISEVADPESEITKLFSNLTEVMREALTKSADNTSAALTELNGRLDDFTKSIETKVSELTAKHDELSQGVARVTDKLGTVEKRIDGVEDDTAIKKSGDLGSSPEVNTLVKSDSRWSGAFFNADNLV